MNVIPFLLYIVAVFVFLLEAFAPGRPRRLVLIPFGLATFTAAVCLTFILQPTWGQVVIR